MRLFCSGTNRTLTHMLMEPRAESVLVILVADDDADMRHYLASCLRGLGSVRIVEAAEGRELLYLARAIAPGLIVSDVMMPGLDGYALCEALKADRTTAAIPLLFISGEYSNPPSGADGFVAKPFNATGLLAEAERLLAGFP